MCIGWCWIVLISFPSISRLAWPTIEPPGVYSSLTMLRGPACNVNPDKSKKWNFSQLIQIFHFRWSTQTYSWWHDSFIVVGIDTNRVTLEVERKLAVLDMFQLIFVQIRPTPDPRIDDMWEALATSDLQSTVECPLNRHTLAWMGSICGNGSDEWIQFIALLFQLLHQRLDGSLCKSLGFAPLLDVQRKQQQIVKFMQNFHENRL